MNIFGVSLHTTTVSALRARLGVKGMTWCEKAETKELLRCAFPMLSDKDIGKQLRFWIARGHFEKNPNLPRAIYDTYCQEYGCTIPFDGSAPKPITKTKSYSTQVMEPKTRTTAYYKKKQEKQMLEWLRQPPVHVRRRNYVGLPLRRGHKSDAGLDLALPQDYVHDAYDQEPIIDFRVSVIIPDGFCALLCPRSSFTLAGGRMEIGVIDAQYTGNIKAKFHCIPEEFQAGQRVAQLVLLPVSGLVVEGDFVEDDDGDRGDDGFGSTGR